MKTQQEQAIEKISGPTIILAGAGTGKSYTLKKKVVYLVNTCKSYKPSEILCLTFSNEATNSLKIGLREELQTTEDVVVKTFHAFCADIIREKGYLIDIEEGFEILLPDDAKILLHKYLNVSPYWANRYISTINTAKDFGISLDQIKEFTTSIQNKLEDITSKENFTSFEKESKLFLQTYHLLDKNSKRINKDKKKVCSQFIEQYHDFKKFNEFIDVWEKYSLLKKEKNYLDFSDLNELVLQLFDQFGAEEYSNVFKYVFIDEFQDTNKLQFRLIEYIASHQNITIVGDPNQSIYGFRGAFKDSFEQFKQVFHVDDSCIFKLDKSYRSINTVLNISYDLIKQNYENLDDCVYVQNVNNLNGDNVQIIETLNESEEARYISDLVQKKIKEGIPLNEICILHRTHQQAKKIKNALDLKGIPVITAGRTNLLQRPEIQTAIAYLSMVSNIITRSGTGEQAWWYLFHYQNTVSLEDSIKIGRFLKEKNHDVEIQKQESIDILLLTANKQLHLSSDTQRVIKRIGSTLQKLASKTNKPLPELILDIYELTGLNRAFSYERSIPTIEAMLNLKKFYELAVNYYELHEKELSKFIEYIEMIDNLDVNIDASKVLHIDAVRLMTIHASKGLEFNTVIVCNMARDRFPVTRTKNEPLIPKEINPDFKAYLQFLKEQNLSEHELTLKLKEYDKHINLFEERRLCYVAWTRAKNELYITYALDYKGEPNSTTQSEFLNEINYVDNSNIVFYQDAEERSMDLAHQSPFENELSLLKKQIISALDTDSFEDLQIRIAKYISCKENRLIGDIAEHDIKEILAKKNKNSIIRFDSSTVTFSPTALITFIECPKRYELSKIFQMPERGDFESNGEGNVMGSFIHKVCEEGVKQKFNSLEEYKTLAIELKKGEFEHVNIDSANSLLDVFWERNKNKISEKSITEMELSFKLENFKFYGIADRVDILDDGTVEVVDYKTNKNPISPEKRALQLGFYALALQEKGFKVSKLTLDMLRLDTPVEMLVDEEGNVTALTGCNKTANFNLNELKQKIIQYCDDVSKSYEFGFEITKKDDSCRYCGFKFYCPKQF